MRPDAELLLAPGRQPRALGHLAHLPDHHRVHLPRAAEPPRYKPARYAVLHRIASTLSTWYGGLA